MTNKEQSKKKTPPTEFLKYAGMGFQFLAGCLLGFLLGRFLDQKFPNAHSMWTATCTICFMLAVLLNICLDVLKPK